MRLMTEIYRALGAEAGAGVQYTVIDGQGGYFQNVKKIPEFSDTVVVLRGRKGTLRVEGRSLAIGKYSGGDVILRGEILKVERA